MLSCKVPEGAGTPAFFSFLPAPGREDTDTPAVLGGKRCAKSAPEEECTDHWPGCLRSAGDEHITGVAITFCSKTASFFFLVVADAICSVP